MNEDIMFDPNPELDSILQKLINPHLKRIDPSLERIERLLQAIGNPQNNLPEVIIHVAGTNGKGSTIAYIHSILSAAGYQVHKYISPHLVHFNERISIAGSPVEPQKLKSILSHILHLQDKFPATFFEATTAAAFWLFAQSKSKADILLLETGMGGRLDATNVIISPKISVITPIGIDHSKYLGNTIAEIAQEKAAIMLPGSTAIIAPQSTAAKNIIDEYACKYEVDLYAAGVEWNFQEIKSGNCWQYVGYERYNDIPAPALLGSHQIVNAATAVATIEQIKRIYGLSITKQNIFSAMQQVEWPARLQYIHNSRWHECINSDFKGKIYIDGGHNHMAAKSLALWLQSQNTQSCLLVGMMQDKNADEFFAPFTDLRPSPVVYTVAIPREENCHNPEYLANVAAKYGLKAVPVHTPEDGLNHIAQDATETIVLICGSLYLTGYILAKIN